MGSNPIQAALWQGWSPVQRALPAVYKVHSYKLILMGNRQEGLIRKVEEEEEEEEEEEGGGGDE
jgi:hypothetical protein